MYGGSAMLRYYKLFDLLNRRNMKRTDLLEVISPPTLAKIGKGKNIQTDVINKICSFSSGPLISNFQFTIFSHLLLIETVQVSPYLYWGRVTLREKNISFFLSHSPPLPLVLREDIFKGIFLSIISVLSMENLIIFPIFVQSPRYDLA